MRDPLDEVWSSWRVDPCDVVTLDRARAEEPNFDLVMKWYDVQGRYERCELMICTVPQSVREIQVFGLFVIDVPALERRNPKPIEQDYLVRPTRGGPTVYYSGQPQGHPLGGSAYWQDIDAFCLRVGRTGEYGCVLTGKHWWVPDHHRSLKDPLFDLRPDIRAAVDRALDRARTTIDLWRMGAAPRP
jgi:hypothetical protein